MYDVTVKNNYFMGFTVDHGNQVFAPGGNYQFPHWGNHTINIPGMGDVNFIDLGDKKLSQYTNPKIPWTNSTWGGLIRYRGLDAYFRYEGQGLVQVTIDAYGSVHLQFPKGGMIVSLDDLTVGRQQTI